MHKTLSLSTTGFQAAVQQVKAELGCDKTVGPRSALVLQYAAEHEMRRHLQALTLLAWHRGARLPGHKDICTLRMLNNITGDVRLVDPNQRAAKVRLRLWRGCFRSTSGVVR